MASKNKLNKIVDVILQPFPDIVIEIKLFW